MGSNVTVYCHSLKVNCRDRLQIYLNEEQQTSLEKVNCSTVRLHLVNFRTPQSTLRCDVVHRDIKTPICGQTIEPGYPPENPTNVSCLTRRDSKSMLCSWKKGKETHIATSYTVTFEQTKTFSLQSDHAEKIQVALSSFENEFSVSIKAKNLLGEALSDVIHLRVKDIVIPNPPTITSVDFVNCSEEAVVHWNESETPESLSVSVRHSPGNGHRVWVHQQESDHNEGTLVLRGFQPFTQYAFQMQACVVNRTSQCSGWGPSFTVRSPEAAPSKRLDLWRIVGGIQGTRTRNVTVLWKPLAPQDCRGQIQGYRVFYRKDVEDDSVVHTCEANATQYTVTLPPAVRRLLVTTFTSAGSSPAAELITGQTVLGKPTITNLTSVSRSALFLTWESYWYQNEPALWYIIQWTGNDQDIQWKKVAANHNSAYIEANSPGVRFTILLFAVTAQGESQPASAEGYSQEEKPLAGPKVLILKTEERRILIQWEEIPLHQRRGFIRNYIVYLMKDPEQAFLKNISVPGNFSHQLWLERLDPRSQYIIHMTASTAAGEGPRGPNKVFYFQRPRQPDRTDVTTVILLCLIAVVPVTVLANLMFWNCIRQRLKRICMSWGPKWLFEKIPKAKNSTVIKLFEEKERNESDSSWLSMYSDPPITNVEELVLFPDHSGPHGQASREESAAAVAGSVGNPETNVFPAERYGYKPQLSKEEQESETSEGSDNLWLVPPFMDIYPTQTGSVSPAVDCGILTSVVLNMTPGRPSRKLITIGDIHPSVSSPMQGTGFTGRAQLEALTAGQDDSADDSADDWDQGQTLLLEELANCLSPSSELDPTENTFYFPQGVFADSDCRRA
ncbi:I12R2 protein, partial [Amia calva]|nr:I12R2 protein [Amia calva]